jgi:transcriptional regulator with XRE-family HTH domain
MCGLRQSTIDNIVRGVTKDPRVQTLHHIALGLNMTLSEFLDFGDLNDYSFEDEQ